MSTTAGLILVTVVVVGVVIYLLNRMDPFD